MEMWQLAVLGRWPASEGCIGGVACIQLAVLERRPASDGCIEEVAYIRRLYWRGGLHQTAVLERWPASDGCIGEVTCSQLAVYGSQVIIL